MRVAMLFAAISWTMGAGAALDTTETDTSVRLANDRLTAVLDKTQGSIVDLFLDCQDLLGPQSGSDGIGPYLDCYCTPSGFYTAGSTAPQIKVVRDTDSTETKYGGIILSETYAETGQLHWLLHCHCILTDWLGHGPLHSDLTVDGIVYNYLVSNHHGESTPTITDGFDRTFGPQYYLFNGGPPATLEELRDEAGELANSNWNTQFYDSIAKHVVGYVPSIQRGSVQGQIELPDGAIKPLAILTVDGQYFQDNSVVPHAHQYWTDIEEEGSFRIDRSTAGETATLHEQWDPEPAGVELWRLGTPDKSSGEFRHGVVRDATHPLHPPEYLIYWGAYGWQADFLAGVNYTIGSSDAAVDFNTVHWSVYGPAPDNPDIEYDTTHDWTIHFIMHEQQLHGMTTATLTIQLAADLDESQDDEPYSNLALESYINGQEEPLTMSIGYNQSSSCIVRSAVSCYQVLLTDVFSSCVAEEG